jgi:hypothetical protein
MLISWQAHSGAQSLRDMLEVFTNYLPKSGYLENVEEFMRAQSGDDKSACELALDHMRKQGYAVSIVGLDNNDFIDGTSKMRQTLLLPS